MKSPLDARRLVKRIVGEYDCWHIFSISTDDCRTIDHIAVGPLTDLGIFERADLDPELKRANWNAPGARGFVVAIDGEIVGVCWYWTGKKMAERNVGTLRPDEAELLQITIAERHRGRHLGRSLIAETALCMKQSGFKRLYAQIWHSNRASKGAFQAAGWSRVGRYYRIAPAWSPRPIEVRRRTSLGRQQGALAGWVKPHHEVT
jgi:ribosomal protein S18 acetylase RimI-like enzyme